MNDVTAGPSLDASVNRYGEAYATPAVASVSVIVPAYGHGAYIVASIESVLAQEPPPLEVIVINDSSPDDTAERLAPLIEAGRITYRLQVNAGMAAARNTGAAMARGDYLYFLDDDDLMCRGALRWMVRELETHPDASMVLGDMVIFDREPPVLDSVGAPAHEVDPVPFVIFNQLGCPGQVLIRRAAFEAAGGFDPAIWGADDWDLWLRLLDASPARVARRPVLAYRLHAQNASRNVARMYRSSLHVARRHASTLPADRRTILRRYTYLRLRRYHAPRIATMVRDAVHRGDWRTVGTASRTWVMTWVNEAAAYLALKLHLVRRGRWSMPADEPLSRVIAQHCDGL